VDSGAREGDRPQSATDGAPAGDDDRQRGDEPHAGADGPGLNDPLDRLRPGTNVVVTGPSMVGKVSLCYRLLAPAADAGRAIYVVATSEPADRARERYADYVSGWPDDLAVVDCMTRQAGLDGAADGDDRTWYVSSPGDLTGVGMAVSKAMAATPAERRSESRLLFDSVSTLLLYSDVETVYRFLHAATGRVQDVDGYGLFVLHSDALDEQTEATVTQLFDAVLEVREGDETGAEYRLSASGTDSEDWHRFTSGGVDGGAEP
jgi:KaiC/GvpD/RAD55 family RecA-like ATPase